MYQLVVFDWDGTLMDSVGRITACMQAAIEELQLPPRTTEQIQQIIGLGLNEAIATLFPEINQRQSQELTASYRNHYLVTNTTPMIMFNGARDLLDQLKQDGYKLAIATGKSRIGLNQVLQQEALSEYFQVTRCADESTSKPDPRMLREILAELDVAPQYAVMVGDSEYDIQMAHNAGVDAVGISHGVHGKRHLLTLAPRACVDSLDELGQWLRQLRINHDRSEPRQQHQSID